MTILATAQPGDSVTFGSYPQTADGADSTPIQWRVLENTGSELFLLSEYILDCKRYHGEFVAVTWRDCDLREWLNDEFFSAAFDAGEQGLVRMTRCTDNGDDTPDTDDRVFLLSATEVQSLTDKLGKDFLRARGTEFAKVKKADGCHLYVMDKNIPSDYISEGGKKYGCSWWWLRNQGRLKDKGNDPSRAAFIGQRASIRHYARVNQAGDGVRPAVKLALHQALVV
ncbi:MAG: hypothetical protein IT319_22880 [Anaerolineae bacterium]|nr:hypothetical protein [Anaerolineae bacterium]